MTSSEASSLPPKLVGKDPCWVYGERVEPNNPNKMRCKYCQHVLHGGITRLKQHLAWIKGNCTHCDKVPDNVTEKVIAMLDKAKRKKDAKKTSLQNLLNDVHVGKEDEEDMTSEGSSRQSIFRPMKVKGLMDRFTQSPEEFVETGSKTMQPAMDSKFRRKAREDAMTYIAKWFYESGIAFNAATLPSF